MEEARDRRIMESRGFKTGWCDGSREANAAGRFSSSATMGDVADVLEKDIDSSKVSSFRSRFCGFEAIDEDLSGL